jgi:DNA adenine methylase
MSEAPLVPPVKCQGIKTKLVSDIRALALSRPFSRWVEPFCGSCVVALNIQPKRALLCDSNAHIIRLYQDVQAGRMTPGDVRLFLTEEGEALRQRGEDYYYDVRQRFNSEPNSLDFLFLNRCCFNGLIRFNRQGQFNTPFGHKPGRFGKAYVTKIVNQVRRIGELLCSVDWSFQTADFRVTLAAIRPDDFVYCDPPYAGRHADYYSQWSQSDEDSLSELLKALPAQFLLSTWHSNRFRTNPAISEVWHDSRFCLFTREHFYHVGATEDLRNEMLEALITNFAAKASENRSGLSVQTSMF